ncbi:MAG TPA: NUDIX domain-containing protein [Balneolales bacterium]|nr:NUDIX domain-containing protein [Balneolales bacterium]
MTGNKVIDVYPYYVSGNEIKYLLLHRSSDHIYSEQWRMIGGKVEEGEKSWEAGLRELKEETGAEPLKYWTIPSINHFYDHITDQIMYIPAFAAELHTDSSITLNGEHDDFRWVEYEVVKKWIHWPEQLRMFEIIDKIVRHDKILPNWIIE